MLNSLTSLMNADEGCFLLLFDGEVHFTFRVYCQREFLLEDKEKPYLC